MSIRITLIIGPRTERFKRSAGLMFRAAARIDGGDVRTLIPSRGSKLEGPAAGSGRERAKMSQLCPGLRTELMSDLSLSAVHLKTRLIATKSV
eukprot:scaffold7520_cov140-Skeletonema_marinoi.AAC.3